MSDFPDLRPGPEKEPQVDLAAAKSAARSLLLKARKARSKEDLQRSDQAILAALSDFVHKTRPRIIALYVPFATEPGAHLDRPLPGYFAEQTAPVGVYVPVLKPDKDLDWTDWPQPRGRRDLADADLVIVPALAVDLRGVRLGRGGGSYDRALKRTRADVVALLHDGELAHSLPAQPHDRRVSGVITPTTGMVRLPLGVDEYSGPVPLLALDL